MPGTDRKVFPEKVTNKQGQEKGGILAPIGDPLGKGLETGLSPIGAGIGKATGPVAEGASNVTKPLMESLGMGDRGELKEQEAQKNETIGGKEQTGQNPLGL
ncbi:hypothetical protein K461DRAFT_317427 [Myriangium duriaei CBS 260.36]|uniref:Uncharacterized protein n=1 Tax=Myriangium duriaei CBS 260.36 TaxID=1168546 RepID=A0A9P4JAY4_9PEZI|nr:hypothetical protein K461DRAFT_317427 [Myriangium duriaei CBS 260.36]